MSDYDITEILKNRGAEIEGHVGPYGRIEDNAQITWDCMEVFMKSPSWGRTDAVFRHWVYMTVHKIARALSGDPDYVDNPVDVEGYSRCMVNHLRRKRQEEQDTSELGSAIARTFDDMRASCPIPAPPPSDQNPEDWRDPSAEEIHTLKGMLLKASEEMKSSHPHPDFGGPLADGLIIVPPWPSISLTDPRTRITWWNVDRRAVRADPSLAYLADELSHLKKLAPELTTMEISYLANHYRLMYDADGTGAWFLRAEFGEEWRSY